MLWVDTPGPDDPPALSPRGTPQGISVLREEGPELQSQQRHEPLCGVSKPPGCFLAGRWFQHRHMTWGVHIVGNGPSSQ